MPKSMYRKVTKRGKGATGKGGGKGLQKVFSTINKSSKSTGARRRRSSKK